MKKNVVRMLVVSVLMALIMTVTAFAGEWKEDSKGWWWLNDDGSYPVNTWQWIDGNKDGIAECYYFDAVGYCLLNATTPDGYQVSRDGAWIVNGSIQTKAVAVTAQNQASVTQHDEFIGEYVLLHEINSDTLNVTKNADGTYRFVKTVGGIVQYDLNANKSEKIDRSMFMDSADEVRFTDAATGKLIISYYYYDSPTYFDHNASNHWTHKPDYTKLDALKANRKFDGTFVLKDDPEGIYNQLKVTKKSGNVYNFKFISEGEVYFEYNAVRNTDSYVPYGSVYDSVEFFDEKTGYYRIAFELLKAKDYYSYNLGGEDWYEEWMPINK